MIQKIFSWIGFFMVIGLCIAAGSELKEWSEVYKTMGNVPCSDFSDMVFYVVFIFIFYRMGNVEERIERQVNLIKRALREYDKEKA